MHAVTFGKALRNLQHTREIKISLIADDVMCFPDFTCLNFPTAIAFPYV